LHQPASAPVFINQWFIAALSYIYLFDYAAFILLLALGQKVSAIAGIIFPKAHNVAICSTCIMPISHKVLYLPKGVLSPGP